MGAQYNLRLTTYDLNTVENLLKFLKSQKLMAIASRTEKDVWIANVYIGVSEDGTIYFLSPEDTKHSRMIIDNPEVAFSVAWFDNSNPRDRKAIQGLGVCHPTKNPIEIAKGAKLLYDKFPDLRDILTAEWVMKNAWGSKIWVLKPSYMKFWNDELYGEKESEGFNF